MTQTSDDGCGPDGMFRVVVNGEVIQLLNGKIHGPQIKKWRFWHRWKIKTFCYDGRWGATIRYNMGWSSASVSDAASEQEAIEELKKLLTMRTAQNKNGKWIEIT